MGEGLGGLGPGLRMVIGVTEEDKLAFGAARRRSYLSFLDLLDFCCAWNLPGIVTF